MLPRLLRLEAHLGTLLRLRELAHRRTRLRLRLSLRLRLRLHLRLGSRLRKRDWLGANGQLGNRPALERSHRHGGNGSGSSRGTTATTTTPSPSARRPESGKTVSAKKKLNEVWKKVIYIDRVNIHRAPKREPPRRGIPKNGVFINLYSPPENAHAEHIYKKARTKNLKNS